MTSRQSLPLLIATTNEKKLRELQALLTGLPLDLRTLADLGDFTEVEETGTSFEANAILKARGYSQQSGLLTLGEDSGLCCDALDGAPGVYSARFAGESKSDLDNNEKLLRLLKNVPDNCRGAHYNCTIAVCDSGTLIGVVSGEVHGFIAEGPSGNNGFGYDPLFYYPDFQQTFGQADPARKNEVSHRAKALKKLRTVLEEYLKEKEWA